MYVCELYRSNFNTVKQYYPEIMNEYRELDT